MEFELRNGILKFRKELTELDKMVIDFVNLLNESRIKYVIISGYVAIVLGRSRGTEDVDMFIEHLDLGKFGRFFELLHKRGYWLLNAESKEDGLEALEDNVAIRVAKKGEAVPNFEIKYPKKNLDLESLEHPMEMNVNDNKLLVSRLEIEIPFKIWLGSDKDIEDAVHIYELFKGRLDSALMSNTAARLNVQKEMKKYGIE